MHSVSVCRLSRAHIGSLSETNINIAAVLNGELYDFLYDDDILIEIDAAGFYCGCCLPEFQKHYATIENLRREHLFDGLNAWITKDLLPARWLSIHSKGGTTYAELSGDLPFKSDQVALIRLPGGG
ncbi:MAG: hypothetical protein K2X57_28780 [Xanthobacteraceae bacterium]|nr:hypothetical protein [Xanthobacteraceae bacterium]